MKISLNLIESDSEIQNLILKDLIKLVNAAFQKATKNISNKLKSMVRDAIESEPEYRALKSQSLRYELGIDDVSKIDNIVNIWSNNIVVESRKVKISGSSLSGGISFKMIQSDYRDVLDSSAASITDRKTGSVVPWLYWLLLGGGGILVKDYEVQFGPSERSRTGNAIMVSSQKNWRMPTDYVGVADNNWVYRAISKLDKQIEQMLQQQLEQSI